MRNMSNIFAKWSYPAASLHLQSARCTIPWVWHFDLVQHVRVVQNFYWKCSKALNQASDELVHRSELQWTLFGTQTWTAFATMSEDQPSFLRDLVKRLSCSTDPPTFTSASSYPTHHTSLAIRTEIAKFCLSSSFLLFMPGFGTNFPITFAACRSNPILRLP